MTKKMAKICLIFSVFLANSVSLTAAQEYCNPNDPNSFQLSIEKMCELVPERGHGRHDIIRIYYNPVLQQCLPFSWSGEGGNANRFISIKNCYEICHPSDPGIRKLTGSGIRPYLVNRKSPKYCNENRAGIPELGIPPSKVPKSDKPAVDDDMDDNQKAKKDTMERGRDVVYRKIPHPYDPSKTLTIIQPVSYVIRDPNQKPRVIIEKHIVHVPYMSNPYGNPYGSPYGGQPLQSRSLYGGQPRRQQYSPYGQSYGY